MADKKGMLELLTEDAKVDLFNRLCESDERRIYYMRFIEDDFVRDFSFDDIYCATCHKEFSNTDRYYRCVEYGKAFKFISFNRMEDADFEQFNEFEFLDAVLTLFDDNYKYYDGRL